MRLPVSWLREWVDVPADGHLLEQALVGAGIEVEEVIDLSSTVDGPLVVGRVTAIEELTGLKKQIRYCQVDVGTTRGIICGARNFAVGDLVVVALPGTVLPGGFAIAARKTKRHVSDGMICSARELGIGDDHRGVILLPPDPAPPGPTWMRRRLPVAGIRSISLAVDITNYLMLELGQPMHAFDPNRLSGPLVVRRARPGERLTTLDGVARALDPEDMVICDETGPISLAAVMGGESSEMLPGSVDVLFGAAHWGPVVVSRTARRHRLLSEAAKRWERGVDPQTGLVALEKAGRPLTTHAGGELDPRILDLDAVAPPLPVTVPADLPSRVAGVEYEAARVTEILTEIGCGIEPVGDALVATPPTWRPDLLQPADFAEEVVRLDGYGKVPSVLPVAPPGRGLTPQQRRKRSVGRALAENGYVEVLSYPFTSASVLDALQLPEGDPRRRVVRVTNPLSDEEPLLRTTLLPPLLGTLRRNLGRGHRDLALYEVGPVFRATGAEGAPPAMGVQARPSPEDLAAAERFVPEQPWHVAVVLAGDVEPAGWWGSGRSAIWADAVEA